MVVRIINSVGNRIVIVSLIVLINGMLNIILIYNLLLARYVKLVLKALKNPL